MGVYSNLAIQKINEQEMLENFQFSDLLEFAINIQKSDQAMFDAMLEMDFHEAYEEKGIISLTEGEKIDAIKAAAKGIWNKIIEALNKFVSMVKTFLAKITNLFVELSGKNKLLVKKIGKFDDKKTYQLHTAIGDNNKSQVTIVVDHEKFVNALEDGLDAVHEIARKSVTVESWFLDDRDKKKINDVNVDNIKSEIETATKDLYSGFEKHFEKVSLKDSVSKVDLNALYESVNNPGIGRTLTDKIKGYITDINKWIGDYKKDKKGDDVSPEDRAKYSKIISALNLCMTATTKVFSVLKNYYARKSATDRALYTKYGVLLGIKLTAGDNVKLAGDFNTLVGGAVAGATKKAAKDAAGKVAKTAKDAGNAIKSKFTKKEESKESTTEAAEELEYRFMTIDVVNETYIDQLFA